MILEEFTKEYIVEKRLFPYIPFYIARYEKEITSDGNIENAVRDLKYFRDEIIRLYEAGELSENEIIDLKGFINTIITHITNGNKSEERLVNVMGGTVIETESERLRREGMSQGMSEGIKQGISEGIRQGISEGIRQGISQGKAQLLIEMGKEEGLDDAVLLKRMQDKIGLSLEQAAAYLKQYGSMVSDKE